MRLVDKTPFVHRLTHPAPKVSLRLILIVPFFLQTAAVAGLVGYLALNHGRQAMPYGSRDRPIELAAQVTQYLDSYLDTPILVNHLGMEALRNQQLALHRSSQIEQYLIQQLQPFQYLRRPGKSNHQSKLGIPVGSSPLSLFLSEPGNIRRIHHYQIDPQNNQASLVKIFHHPPGQDLGWYDAATTARNPIRAALQTDDEGAGLTLPTATPIYDPRSGQLQGVVASLIPLTELQQALRALNISPSGRLFIIERNGLLVATSTRAPIVRLHPPQSSQPLARLLASHSKDQLIRGTSQFLLAHFGGFNQITTTQQLYGWVEDPALGGQGERVLIQTVPYRDNLGLDWLIVVAIPESDLVQEMQWSERVPLVLALITLLGTMGLGLLTTIWIVRPIKQLSQASRDLALGKWDYPVKQSTWIAEVEILTRSFNQMMEGIEQSFDQIKQALEESEERFTKIFRTSPDPIAIASSYEGRYLEVNESFLQFTGFSREEVIGKPAIGLSMWANVTERERFRSVLQERRSVRNFEVGVRTASGESKTVLLSAEMVNIEGQSCMIVIAKDITERQQAAEPPRPNKAIV